MADIYSIPQTDSPYVNNPNGVRGMQGIGGTVLDTAQTVAGLGSMIPGVGALAAIPAAIQAGTGIYQLIRGNQLANSMERPNYSIPQEVLDNLTDAEIQALRGLPAEQRQQYLDNVMRSQQASLGAMDDRKGGLAGLAGVQQQSNDAYRNLLTMDAQARMDAEQRLQGVRTQVADAKDKEWQLNELNPYMETMQAAEAMRGAGLQNIMGGATAGAQMGLDYAKYMKLLNSFGNSSQTV